MVEEEYDNNPFLGTDKTPLDRMRELEPGSYAEIADYTGIPASTIARSNTIPLYRWSVKTIIGLSKWWHMSPGKFLDTLMQTFQEGNLVVGELDRTIQGVHIKNPRDFQVLRQVMLRNNGLGYVPTADDVKYLLNRLHHPKEEDLKKVKEHYLNKCGNELARYAEAHEEDNGNK